MKPFLRLLPVLLAAVAAAVASAQVTAITPANRRAEQLTHAQKLVQPQDPALPAGVLNPFFSEAYAATIGAQGGMIETAPQTAGAVTRPAGPRQGRDLLIEIADGLRPSGYIVMGGQASLSFGARRVRPGGTLPVTFEGQEYTLEITAIDRTHFTVRLGNEVYTRPIK